MAELTIGYRVPEPILTVANRLLPLTGVDASASRSVRIDGHAPSWTHTTPAELAATVAAVTAGLKHHHRLTGVVAPVGHHPAIAAALVDAGLHAVDHLHQLHPGEVPLFGPEQVKGLEFDGVVVVEPDEILGDTSARRPAALRRHDPRRAGAGVRDDGAGTDAGARSPDRPRPTREP